MKFRSFEFICLFVICLFAYSGKAQASSFSVGIYPPIIQIQALSKATITSPITLQNYADSPVTMDIFLKPFTASEKENGEVLYTDTIGKNPLIFQHIHVLEGQKAVHTITINPSQEKKLTLVVDIGDDEPASDYYFSVVFISKTGVLPNTNGASQTPGGIATNVLLSIGPQTPPQATLEEFSSPFFVEKGPVPFRVRLKNFGEHAIAPRGTIYIKNMFNQIIGKVDLLPVNILSHTIRSVPDSLQSPEATTSALTKINYEELKKTFDKPVALWGESFLLGPYSAQLHVSLSENGPVIVKNIYFIAMPVQATVGLLLGILVVLLIRQRVKRRLT